ncbi:hypothetical protein BJY00DRAFT_315810 [Aspergillus carlsbadensis]|nr:hypothetical protein BJY00DRAFT_315810 [Aspergillus carlsbadensis]
MKRDQSATEAPEGSDQDTAGPHGPTTPSGGNVSPQGGQHHPPQSAPHQTHRPRAPSTRGSRNSSRASRRSELPRGDPLFVIDRLRRKLEAANNDYEDLALENESLLRDCERLQGQMDIARRNIHNLQDRLRQDKTNSDNQASELQDKMTAFQLALREARNKNKRLQNDVVVAQEGALRSMEKENHTFMEDSKVREQLSKIGDRFIAWTKKHALNEASTLESLSPTKMDIIIESLDGFCIQESWHQLQSMLPSLLNKLPVLLTQASISKDILEPMLSNPFFFFFQNGLDDAYGPSPSQMVRVYEVMKSGNEADGHLWRTQTLHALGNARTDTGPYPGLVMPWLLDVFSFKLALKFLNGPITVLLQPVYTETETALRAEGLEKIIHEAASLAVKLWMQRTSIGCHGLGNVRLFSSKTTFSRPHRLHHLDDDDDRLDGHRVVLVTQPLIVAWGDENAENYDKHKVWAKATVCVEESGPQHTREGS